ncbi:MAG: response regulator, partial [Geminicoccaceae bacterium]|nr:response regulator [Geminicoccaceae bacterium]
MNDRRLLLVEDDEALRTQLRWSLDQFDLTIAETREQAITAMRAKEPQVVLLDLGLPPDPEGSSEGLQAMSDLLELSPDAKIIVLTGREGRDHALKAVAGGAHDYHQKPTDPEHLSMVLERAFYMCDLEQENRKLNDQQLHTRLPGLVGDSPATLALIRTTERVAPTDVSLALIGE